MRIRSALLFIFFSVITFFACAHDSKTITLTEWEFSNSEAEFENISKEYGGWRRITLPLAIKFPFSEKRDYRYVWLKTKFNISGDPAVYYGISISRLSHIDQVYVNGSLVSERVQGYASMIPLPRNYIIPSQRLKNGVNEIYIRLGIYPNERAGIIQDFRIQPENEFFATKFFDSIVYKQFPLAVATVYITIVVLLAVFFYGEKYGKLLWNFSIPCLGFAFYMLSLYVPNAIISIDVITGFHAFVIYNLLLRIYLIVQSIYKIYFSNNRIIIPLVWAASIFIFIVRGVYQSQAGLYLYVGLLVISIPLYPIAIYRLHKMNPNRASLGISIFFMLSFLLDVGAETFFILIGSLYSDLPSIYFSSIYFSLGAIIIVRESMERRRETEYMYNKLKILEQCREQSNKKLSITESSEGKLKTIIDFLNDNYTSDLSREGLASAVNLNHNYMSRLFKTYTGKKISEYINELRIRDAAEKLKEKNARIIDIALSVGFDSIATFNRAFKYVMHMTPTEFRNNYR